MTDNDQRTWTVTYHDQTLHLTATEYDALKRASYDDHLKAKQMADTYLKREVTQQPRSSTGTTSTTQPTKSKLTP